MVRFLLYISALIVAVLTIAADPEFGAEALLIAALLSAIFILAFRHYTDEKRFVTDIFIGALVARLAFGVMLHSFDLRMFAGPDAVVYDMVGKAVSDYWLGYAVSPGIDVKAALSLRGAGWGISYLMGLLYLIPGQSFLVAQTFCGVIGAATAPMVYFCSHEIFQNKRVAKVAALGVAFFPAFIIWSSQLLKDGFIVFLLVLAMTLVIRLQNKFSVGGLVLLILTMIGIMSLRFYTFYAVAVAIAGGFVIGLQTSAKAIFQRAAILSVIALSLVYFGFIKIATTDLQTYASLDRINYSRSVMADSESGYGSDADVSTTGGALAAIPVGFAYLMLAPFPWEMKNFRQSLTLPDVLLWWSLIPFMIYGLWFTVRHRLRPVIPILIFTFILTLAYSMFQGNLGAAYRQRTQIQVFLFIFIAVGIGILLERREDRKMVEDARKRRIRENRIPLEASHQV